MQLSDLPHYTYLRNATIQDTRFLILFNSLDSVNLFQYLPDGTVHPVGSIDCTTEKDNPLEIAVREEVLILLQPSTTQPHTLDGLLSLITEARTLAESLRESESAATSDNKAGAVGRELSYAIVKLKEAGFWVREAVEIKESCN